MWTMDKRSCHKLTYDFRMVLNEEIRSTVFSCFYNNTHYYTRCASFHSTWTKLDLNFGNFLYVMPVKEEEAMIIVCIIMSFNIGY